MADAQEPSSRWLISGRVQGVGFRWYTLRRANELGIRGWARNLPDGRVEVVGQGEGDALLRFDEALRDGPAFANVENVEKLDFPHEVRRYNSFEIN